MNTLFDVSVTGITISREYYCCYYFIVNMLLGSVDSYDAVPRNSSRGRGEYGELITGTQVPFLHS